MARVEEGGRRRGKAWSTAEHTELLAGLKAGWNDREIAERLGRSVKALRARAVLMVGRGPGNGLDRLRRAVSAHPERDWEGLLRDELRRRGRPMPDEAIGQEDRDAH